MPRLLREGIHKVKVITAELGESASGKERIELGFESGDGSLATRFLYLTPAAKPYTDEILEALGVDPDDDTYLDRLDALVGRGCKVRVATPTSPTATPEVVSVWPLDENRPKPSQEELRARIKKRLKEPAPVEAPPTEEVWHDDEQAETPATALRSRKSKATTKEPLVSTDVELSEAQRTEMDRAIERI